MKREKRKKRANKPIETFKERKKNEKSMWSEMKEREKERYRLKTLPKIKKNLGRERKQKNNITNELTFKTKGKNKKEKKWKMIKR